MLLEIFHWDAGTLAKTDIDLVLPLINYYPYWKAKKPIGSQEEQIYIDQVNWL